MSASSSNDKFNNAIDKVKVPILILDNKWHRLFGKMDPGEEIAAYEKELAELLKKQGRIFQKIKDLKKAKGDLMQGIVNNMDGVDNRDTDEKADKMLSESKRLINDVNDEIDKNEDEMLELPKQIDEVNRKLMYETMELCYERLQDNTSQIEEISKWIKDIRIELKKNIIKKQDMELYNAELYSYMHDIFGPEVMEIFDMKYVPSIHKKINELKSEDGIIKEDEEMTDD